MDIVWALAIFFTLSEADYVFVLNVKCKKWIYNTHIITIGESEALHITTHTHASRKSVGLYIMTPLINSNSSFFISHNVELCRRSKPFPHNWLLIRRFTICHIARVFLAMSKLASQIARGSRFAKYSAHMTLVARNLLSWLPTILSLQLYKHSSWTVSDGKVLVQRIKMQPLLAIALWLLEFSSDNNL